MASAFTLKEISLIELSSLILVMESSLNKTIDVS